MLLSGINHVAVLTQDTDRLHAFYRDVFGATVFADQTISEGEQQGRLSFVTVGPHTQFNVFELPGDAEAETTPRCSAAGRIDHIGLQAESQEAFDEIRRAADRARLPPTASSPTSASPSACSSSIPTGSRARWCSTRPAPGPTDIKPPGTPAVGYERVADT